MADRVTLSMSNFILIILIVVLFLSGSPLKGQSQTAQVSPLSAGNDAYKTANSTDGSRSNVVDLKRQRFNEIQTQVEQLSILWKDMQRGVTPQQEPGVNGHQKPTPTNPNSMKTSSADAHRNVRDIPPVDQLDPRSNQFNSINIQDPETSSEAAEKGNAEAKQKSTTAYAGPIDRFALSTSLYATANYAECFSVVDAMVTADLTPYEKLWSEYLKASCHRKLGQTSEAQRIYRKLVANTESAWIGEMSRWWLDHLQERDKLEAEFTQFTTAILQWETEVDELINITHE